MRGVVLGHTDSVDYRFLEPKMALIRAIRPIRGRSLFRVRFYESGGGVEEGHYFTSTFLPFII